MYALIKSLGWQRLVKEQAVPLLIAWGVTEAFYKFHSFTLECAAFLATWFVLDFAMSRASSRHRRAKADQ